MKRKLFLTITIIIIILIIIFLIGYLNYDNYYDSIKHNTLGTNECCVCDDCKYCDVCCRCRDKSLIIKSYKGYLYIFKLNRK